METSRDQLLNGSVKLEQPVNGYRVAIDPVFLAAAIPARDGEMILDVGCGVGAAMLCLARRVPGIRVFGLELQAEYARLAQRNIRENHFQQRLEVITGDILAPLPRLAASSFHHVMTNPPFHALNRTTPAADTSKVLATVESHVSLKKWIDFCLLMVRPKGTVTLVFPPDRLEEILPLFHPRAGDLAIYPLWTNAQKPAKRLLIRARKNSAANTRIFPGMLLHSASGQYTDEADLVLRSAGAINF